MPKKKNVTMPSNIQKFLNYKTQVIDHEVLEINISEHESFSVNIKQLLDVNEMNGFVESVTEAVFINDQYIPSIFNLVLSKAIISYYTDIAEDISTSTLMQLIYCSNIIDTIRSKVNKNQFLNIEKSIQQSIEWKKRTILNTQSAKLDMNIQHISYLVECMSKINEQFQGIDMSAVSNAAIKLAETPKKELIDKIIDINSKKANKNV